MIQYNLEEGIFAFNNLMISKVLNINTLAQQCLGHDYLLKSTIKNEGYESFIVNVDGLYFIYITFHKGILQNFSYTIDTNKEDAFVIYKKYKQALLNTISSEVFGVYPWGNVTYNEDRKSGIQSIGIYYSNPKKFTTSIKIP